ncbi:DUF2314 domain-containing protein [Yoonia sp. 2307UL14-13]|uniref:DUF2314 domain-containing protein n=1 Tax=Yoonia sp. 2307UL14-13 TaxID=3126506 RepID=UPI0030B285A8
MLGRVATVLFIGLTGPVLAQDGDPVTGFDSSDPVMNVAIAQAQFSLPLFLCEKVDDEGYGPGDGYLKVRVPVQNAEVTHEVIWVGPFAAWDGENFAGFLANQPNAMPGLNAGDQLDFTYDMIVDWSWTGPDGLNYGHYTTRVIYEQLGDQAFLQTLANPPYDADWTCD